LGKLCQEQLEIKPYCLGLSLQNCPRAQELLIPEANLTISSPYFTHLWKISGFRFQTSAAEIPSLQDAVSSLQAHLQNCGWGASKTMSSLNQHGVAAFLCIKAHLVSICPSLNHEKKTLKT
jgi:hypothetical protein